MDEEVSDVEKQMEIDPTGVLAMFWQEQKRMLHRKTKQTPWHPKVLAIYVYIYIHICTHTHTQERDATSQPVEGGHSAT